MSANNGPAEIVDMNDARARHRGEENPLGEFENVGAMLRATRELAHLSLAEVAEATHIKESHLEAIENLNLDALPARPYAIGFVKAYAKYLRLEADPIAIRFKEEAEIAAPPPVEVEKFEAAEAAADIESRDLSIWALIAIIAFIVWCFWQITRPQEVTILSSDTPTQIETPVAAPKPAPPDASAVVIEAKAIERVEPVYPRSCSAGPAVAPTDTVVVTYTITSAGQVTGERIAQSSNECLNDSALNAIKRWRFEPRTVDGAARPAYDQKYSFSFVRPQ